MRLTRKQLFFTGMIIILAFYGLNRLNRIWFGEKVEGKFVFYVEEEAPEGTLISPIVEYKVKDSVYQFKAREGIAFEINEPVTILLRGKDPDKPELFTIGSFWLFPLVYWILPLAIWTAFSLSYVNQNERLEMKWKYPFFKKKKIADK